MIGYYNYTVILTYLSLISAMFGTHLAFNQEYVGALICLLFCGAFDSFDGIVARTKKDRTDEEKKFGIQIDSLVDVIAFGIFPAIIGYSMGLTEWYWGFVFCLFACGAVSRLAYFNVAEETRQNQTAEKRKYYQGLPVTSASLIFPAVYLLKCIIGFTNMTLVYGVMMAVVAVAFVVNFKVVKPGLRGVMIMVVVGLFVCIGMLLV
ncbi:MAG: CDP-alcohol phosphatidyltransferase family protein [Coprobacillus sp.]